MVQEYLNTQRNYPDFPPAGAVSITGRGYPDIAILGAGQPVMNSYQLMSVGGTSMSAPIMNGFVAQVCVGQQHFLHCSCAAHLLKVSAVSPSHSPARELPSLVFVPQQVRDAGLTVHVLHPALQINGAIRATPGLEDKTIGYMNPFLYWAAVHYPKAFNDITEGYNGYEVAADGVNDIVSPSELALPIYMCTCV